MKIYIKNSENAVREMHFTELFSEIAEIFYVDSIESHVSIYAADDPSLIDYSAYSDSELLNLSTEDTHSINDLYTISRIYNLDRRRLTRNQQQLLQSQYHVDPNDPNSATWRYYIDDTDIQNILDMLKKHDWVDGPVHSPDPHKNFARYHRVNLTPLDYVHILHSLTVNECRILTPYLTVSRNINNLGNNLVVFNVDKEFTLANGSSIGNFKVYIKIDLTQTNEEGDPIALISFHE